MGPGVAIVTGLVIQRTGVTLSRGSRVDNIGILPMVRQVGKVLLGVEGVVLFARVMTTGKMNVLRRGVIGIKKLLREEQGIQQGADRGDVEAMVDRVEGKLGEVVM